MTRQIRKVIQDLNRQGTTVFLTTHYIEEAERLCHQIALIVKGKIVRLDRLEELMREVQQEQAVQLTTGSIRRELLQRMRARFAPYSIRAIGAADMQVTSARPIELVALAAFLGRHGAPLLTAPVLLVSPDLWSEYP